MGVVYPKMWLHNFPKILLPKSPHLPSSFVPLSLRGAIVLSVVAGVVGLIVGAIVPGLLDGGVDEAFELGAPVVFLALHPCPKRII